MIENHVFDEKLLEILQCPMCKGNVELNTKGNLICLDCKETYTIKNSIPIMLPHLHWAINTAFSSDHKTIDAMLSRNKRLERSKCYQTLISYVLSALGEYSKGKTLEVGCGYGNNTKIFESKCSSIVGLDIQHIFDINYLSLNLNFSQGDCTNLPFKNNTFDCVISIDVIEHINRDFMFLEEINRVLKNGGMLVLTTPNNSRPYEQFKKFIGLQTRYPYFLGRDTVLGDVIHIREYNKMALKDLFNKFKFKSVEIKGIWFGLLSPEIGLKTPPPFLEKYSHILFVKAIKGSD